MITLLYKSKWGMRICKETFSSQKTCSQYIRRNGIKDFHLVDESGEKFCYIGNAKITLSEARAIVEKLEKELL